MSRKDKSAQSGKPEARTGEGRNKAPEEKLDLLEPADKNPKRRDKAGDKPKRPDKSGNDSRRLGNSSKSAGSDSRSGLGDDKFLLISRALADPRRLTILRTIARGGTSSCAEVQQHLPISAATLSHHMRELELAGLIETSRDGRFRQAKLQRKVWKSYVGELKAMLD